MKQLTREQAIAIAESGIWKTWTEEQVVKFQLFQDILCVPFSVFHKAIERVLKRPVYTHEFASPEHLKKELLGEKPQPTFEEILNLIPKDKQIIVCHKD